MNTIAKTSRATFNVRTRKIAVTSVSNFWTELEYARFALIPVILVIIGCIGGIAAGFGTNNSIFELAVVSIGTVIPMSLLMAVVPMKPVFYLSVIAVLLDFLILIF